MSSIKNELEKAGDREAARSGDREAKKNYAERLSNALAKRIADELRPRFPNILPDENGGYESRALTGKGPKKLDVNFSTLQLGLGLGVSIKTVNFPDSKTKRYTKNITRVDNELRAEAEDYHTRQPYAVLVALYFAPIDSCKDGKGKEPSSFGRMVMAMRHRARRHRVDDPASLFEKIFVAVYQPDGPAVGDVVFFDVENAPPKRGVPTDMMTLPSVIKAIESEFDRRNGTAFQWAEGDVSTDVAPIASSLSDDDDEE